MAAPVLVRPAEPADHDWILALNRVHEQALSVLDAQGLKDLLSAALLTQAAQPQAGFVVCFDQDAAYDSPNFLWFRDRYPRFLYVDRIAVDASRGLAGVGTALYAQVFAEALLLGYPVVCAEVNTDPPNPGSLAFHARRGFATVGEAHLPDRGKSVRYLAHVIGGQG